MLYRTLGRTGLKVSQLGFGAMRLPMKKEGDKDVVDRELAIPMIHRAFEAGVNYIDSAVMYCNDDSQVAVGEALKGWRATAGCANRSTPPIVVSTKNHYYGEDEKEWWTNLENSLKRLEVSCIDIYNHHGMGWDAYSTCIVPRLGKWMQKAKDQGLIKHIANSFHDNNEALKKLVDSGYTDSITMPYNLLDRSLEDGMAYAKEHGVGVVAMNPVGGGRLGGDSKALQEALPMIKRVPELALRFVLANPNVTVALSGMSTMQQVEENIAIASDGRMLTAEEMTTIDEHMKRLKKMAELYCTACKYCQPCPQHVNIPRVFQVYNEGRVYDMWDSAKGGYKHIGVWGDKEDRRGDSCNECGVCETKCPQKIPIRAQLKEAHAALAEKA
jgi:predicted aldo/keto reductase-like oxidoreductase